MTSDSNTPVDLLVPGIRAVLDLMHDASSMRPRIPGSIAPNANGYSCWFISDEGADHEQFSTAPLTAEEIAERYVRWTEAVNV